MLAKMKLSSAARLDIHINSPQKIEVFFFVFFFCNALELTILSLSANTTKSEWIIYNNDCYLYLPRDWQGQNINDMYD